MSDAMPPGPILRFEEATESDALIVTLPRSDYAKVTVSICRSKYRGGAHIAVCVWFRRLRNGVHTEWTQDKRCMGAILRPEEIDDVIAALRQGRQLALEVNATRSRGDAPMPNPPYQPERSTPPPPRSNPSAPPPVPDFQKTPPRPSVTFPMHGEPLPPPRRK